MDPAGPAEGVPYPPNGTPAHGGWARAPHFAVQAARRTLRRCAPIRSVYRRPLPLMMRFCVA
jgi:hypothetical protein